MASSAIARILASTPARLRAWQVGTVVLAVVVGLLSALGVARHQADLREARLAADSLLRVQEIRVAAVSADSLASRAYLEGGQESAEARAAYAAAIETAAGGLVAVSEQLPAADAAALTTAGADVGRYVGLVEQARANNRQGFPVGAAYQRQANGVLSGSILPALATVEQRTRAAINARLDAAAGNRLWVILPAVAALAAVVAASRWLARRFHRQVNVPLAGAGLVMVVAALLVVVGLTSSLDRATAAVGDDLAAADRVAQARAAAFDARSQEGLTLINRGNGAANEAAWQRSSATVGAVLSAACESPEPAPPTPAAECQVRQIYDAYVLAHQQMRNTDDAGDWDQAVTSTLAPATESALTRSFDEFDAAARSLIGQQAGAARHGLGASLDWLGALRILALIGGLLAALLAGRGFGQRLAEYR